jgi:hypothetical protein
LDNREPPEQEPCAGVPGHAQAPRWNPRQETTSPFSQGAAAHALLRKTKAQALISGWNPNIWGEDDYCILDGEIVVDRIYPEIIKCDPKWMWFLQTEPAPPAEQRRGWLAGGSQGGIQGAVSQIKLRVA